MYKEPFYGLYVTLQATVMDILNLSVELKMSDFSSASLNEKKLKGS